MNIADHSYKVLIQMLPDIVYKIDPEGHFTYINDAISNLGYNPSDLIGKHYTSIIHPDYTESVQRETVLKKYRNGDISSKEQPKIFDERRTGNRISRDLIIRLIPVNWNRDMDRNRTKDTLWELTSVGVYREQDKNCEKNFTGTIGIIRDITSIRRTEQALLRNEKHYRSLLENISEIIMIAANDGTILYVTPSVNSILGYEEIDFIGENLNDFIHEEDCGRVMECIQSHGGRETFRVEHRFIHSNGKDVIILSSGKSVLDDNNDLMCYIINSCDISDRREAENALRQKDEKFRTLIENSSEVIYIIDESGLITYSSKHEDNITGLGADKLINSRITDLVHPEDREYLQQKINSLVSDKGMLPLEEFRFMHKNGEWKHVEITSNNLLEDPLIRGIVLNIRDVTQRKKAEKTAFFYKFYDPLTELPNRDKFLDHLQIELTKSERRQKMLAVMCLGIDRFKEVNEMYGTDIGDELLQQISRDLRSTFRKDDIVSRFGGDQFLILLSDISNSDDVMEIVDKTYSIFSTPINIKNAKLTISASTGVSIFPNDGHNSEILLKNSEIAMYMAKDSGRNTCKLFDHQLHDNMLRRIRLEKELVSAINNDEMTAYYQPRVDHAGSLIGMEALVRWDSPSRGLISPVNFIPVAERSSMIIDIGYLMLKKSCMQNRKWQDQGLDPIQISVNLSPLQFRQPDLTENIKKIIIETGLEPEMVELEITESGIMENEKDSIEKLYELHEMGIALSIDDFGTGYSSLSKLKSYPIDTLKIDKSFIDDIPVDPMSVKITTAIIDLAHNLGFKVVAEGVERKEQLDFLIENQCDFFQGFYFSRPLSKEDMGKFRQEN